MCPRLVAAGEGLLAGNDSPPTTLLCLPVHEFPQFFCERKLPFAGARSRREAVRCGPIEHKPRGGGSRRRNIPLNVLCRFGSERPGDLRGSRVPVLLQLVSIIYSTGCCTRKVRIIWIVWAKWRVWTRWTKKIFGGYGNDGSYGSYGNQ